MDPTRSVPPSRETLQQAAALIRAGRLVAFPTETVYGLGANALDPEAVARIYEAKGRPSTSPLIVHASSLDMARHLALNWPQEADALARRFWPGPLTIVVTKDSVVPDAVTAGLSTVGLRVPDHAVALALLEECGLPLAAPSANRFSRLSPTTAEHVSRGLGNRVDLILDGGPTRVGIESTVVSLAGPRPVLLRPGIIGRIEIEAVTGPLAEPPAASPGEAHSSPGLSIRHYSPATPLVVVRGELPGEGRGAYLWWRQRFDAAREVRMPEEPQGYAALMYQVLHEADAEGWDWIAVEDPPDVEAWAAIHDRLRRAATRGG